MRSVDFERVLRTRSRLSSVHFAVHHLAEPPARVFKGRAPAAGSELSTGLEMNIDRTVDDLRPAAPAGVWLGAVVPKRHARRAVTRSLLKRQIRSILATHEASLDAGLWVVRLRAPFDRAAFVSAASDQLRRAARAELDGLLAAAARRPAAGRA